MTEKRYDGTPVRRTFDDKGNANGFNLFPDPAWDNRDLVLWTLSMVNNETGLSIGAQGPDKDGKFTLTAEFLYESFPPSDTTAITSYLLGVLSGYVASSHGYGVLGRKSAPSEGFATMFGGLFK